MIYEIFVSNFFFKIKIKKVFFKICYNSLINFLFKLYFLLLKLLNDKSFIVCYFGKINFSVLFLNFLLEVKFIKWGKVYF